MSKPTNSRDGVLRVNIRIPTRVSLREMTMAATLVYDEGLRTLDNAGARNTEYTLPAKGHVTEVRQKVAQALLRKGEDPESDFLDAVNYMTDCHDDDDLYALHARFNDYLVVIAQAFGFPEPSPDELFTLTSPEEE